MATCGVFPTAHEIRTTQTESIGRFLNHLILMRNPDGVNSSYGKDRGSGYCASLDTIPRRRYKHKIIRPLSFRALREPKGGYGAGLIGCL